jgi:hypothetical protein
VCHDPGIRRDSASAPSSATTSCSIGRKVQNAGALIKAIDSMGSNPLTASGSRWASLALPYRYGMKSQQFITNAFVTLHAKKRTNREGGLVAEHEHHEADELDLEAGDFWVQIESSQGHGPIWDRSLTLSTSGNVANGTILTTLLFAYIGYHERLLEHHQCSHPDCRLVWVHRQLLGMLETALDQTAQLMEDCDEEPESGEEEDQAD